MIFLKWNHVQIESLQKQLLVAICRYFSFNGRFNFLRMWPHLSYVFLHLLNLGALMESCVKEYRDVVIHDERELQKVKEGDTNSKELVKVLKDKIEKV